MKVLVCDYTGISAQWLENFAIKQNLEIVGTITPDTDKKLLAENSWEYLIVFEQGARQFFAVLAQFMNIPENRVVYALDWNSWATHPAAMYALLDPARGGVAYRISSFNISRQLNYFMSATTADGLHYVATSKDDFVIKPMYLHDKNHAEDEMKFFQKLVKQFYNVDESNGLFLDLGANIGTTGIYFTKILAPNLKLLAFEPDSENFKLLRTNLILNDVEDVIVENYGLGDVESEMTIYRDKINPGHNGVFSNDSGTEGGKIKIIPLDKYFDDNKISPKDVKYIWIDTEGFEPQVLLGMKNILTENPAPIFMEFNPQFWQKSGYYAKLMELLNKFYEGYIWIHEAIQTKAINVRPIDNLNEFRNSKAGFGALGDIFLIHKL